MLGLCALDWCLFIPFTLIWLIRISLIVLIFRIFATFFSTRALILYYFLKLTLFTWLIILLIHLLLLLTKTLVFIIIQIALIIRSHILKLLILSFCRSSRNFLNWLCRSSSSSWSTKALCLLRYNAWLLISLRFWIL